MEALLLKMLNMSLGASGLILVILALRLLLRRAPRRLICLLWVLVALRLLCPVLPTNPWSLAPSAHTIPENIAQSSPPQIHSGIAMLNSTVNPALAQAVPEQQTKPDLPDEGREVSPEQPKTTEQSSWLTPLAWTWLVMACLLAGYSLVSAGLLRRKMAEACLERENIYRSERADSPFVLGLLRPRIYLPSHLDAQSAAYVVAHEQSHIHRKDHWAKVLGWLLVCLHWFNPLVWVAYLLLCRDLELACDEGVIRRMDRQQIAGYAQTLLECSLPRATPGSLAFGRLGVRARVKHILSYRRPAFWLAPATILACGLAAFFWMTQPGQPPQLPVESNVQSISIQQEGQIRVVRDRQQIQAVISALGQAKASNRRQLAQQQLTLWLDDGGMEIHRWQLDSKGLLQGPDSQVYRLGKQQIEELKAVYQQGKQEPVYTLTAMEYGQAGQEIVLTEDSADLARQILWSSQMRNAAFPGQDPAQLPWCWRIRYGDSEAYSYLVHGQPVLQTGQQNQWYYTTIPKELYTRLTGQSLENLPEQEDRKETELPALLPPVQGQITGTFGSRTHPITGEQTTHSGMDFAATEGTPVVASADGQVVQAQWDEQYGNCIVIDHGSGLQTLYGHNQQMLVQVGQRVTQGQQIATVGNSGNSTGPHCHWEVLQDSRPVNPAGSLTIAHSERMDAPEPLTWNYRPARSSVFPAMTLRFDPAAADGAADLAVQVSCNTGTFYRHDETQYPNYQDLGPTAQYALGELVYWSPDLSAKDRLEQPAQILFQVGGKNPLMSGQIVAAPYQESPNAFETYAVSLEADQPLTITAAEDAEGFVISR